jgi:AcrR family transcriptional regulator
LSSPVARGGASNGGEGVRADAERNRARILEVAFAAFAADGLGVSVHEIARRAGVGTGTVSRHFPTKNALIEAIIVDRAGSLMDMGRALREQHAGDPAAAFFGFISTLVAEMAMDRGLADALAGAGIDLEATVAGSGYDVTGMLGDLLAHAQHAGAIRPDATLADVKALMSGCLHDDPTLSDRGAADGGAADVARRRVEIVCAGLLSR